MRYDELTTVDRLIGSGVADARTAVTYADAETIRSAILQERDQANRTSMVQLLERELKRRGESLPYSARELDDRTRDWLDRGRRMKKRPGLSPFNELKARAAVRRLYPIWTYEAIARVMKAGGRPARRGGLLVIDGGRANG